MNIEEKIFSFLGNSLAIEHQKQRNVLNGIIYSKSQKIKKASWISLLNPKSVNQTTHEISGSGGAKGNLNEVYFIMKRAQNLSLIIVYIY